MTKKRAILIFGGSFSPPTLAHEAIIAACLALQQFDEVWVMPSGDRLDKTIAVDDQARLEMLAIVHGQRFGHDPRLRISDVELHMPRPTNTYDTLRALSERFPDYDFSFAFGRDSYTTMPMWPHGDELRQQLSMVILGDDTATPPAAPNVHYVALDEAYSKLSSSRVRDAIAHGRDISGMVSESIARYLHAVI
jgi:nicotinate-nucleotide adenylyltransferase